MGAVPLKAGHSKGIEFLTDALGTVRDIVDDAGAVIQSYEFNVHGIPMAGSGAGSGTFSPKTYQGALSVNDDRNDSGLYLMGHRHYAADLGRFISRDPIGFAGGLNLFNGAGASPVTKLDPRGLQADSRSWGGFINIVGGDTSAVLCIKKLLDRINQTTAGSQMLCKLGANAKDGKAYTINLVDFPIAESWHPERQIQFPSNSKYILAEGHQDQNDPWAPTGFIVKTEDGWVKASPLRALAHELAHLGACDGTMSCLSDPDASCQSEKDNTVRENLLGSELGLKQREYLSPFRSMEAEKHLNAPMEIVGGGLDCL